MLIKDYSWLSRPHQQRPRRDKQLYLEINWWKFPKEQASAGPGEERSGFGGGPTQKGGQGHVPKVPRHGFEPEPKKDEETRLQNDGALAHRLKLS